MPRVNEHITINDSEMQFDFVRSSGPGGQNVNKVSTACQLRFDVKNSPSLNSYTKSRLKIVAGSRMTKDGVLVIDAREHRTQLKNRSEAVRRLLELVLEASKKPKYRVKTKPTKGSQRRRMDSKKKHGDKKKGRSGKFDD